MARPVRHDADYFPFYAKDGRTLFILENKYGCKGTGFFTNVMRLLTLIPDHHLCIKDEADQLYFYSRCKCDEVSGAEMLLMMVKTGKLDRELFEKAGVIMSQDLLDSLGDAYRKRANRIITINQVKAKYGLLPDETPITGAETPENSGDNPQRKGKEIKEKEKVIPAEETKETRANGKRSAQDAITEIKRLIKFKEWDPQKSIHCLIFNRDKMAEDPIRDQVLQEDPCPNDNFQRQQWFGRFEQRYTELAGGDL